MAGPRSADRAPIERVDAGSDPSELRFRLTLEYDGTDFVGWEVQPGQRSIQGEVERALARILGHPVRVAVSGRTDSGVHALGQVAAFTTTASRSATTVRDGLNALLPPDVACRHAELVVPDFDPRRHARTKHYRYRWLDSKVPSPLRRGRVYWIRTGLCATSMDEAALSLAGTHDFATFRAAGCGAATTVRTIPTWRVRRVDDEVQLDVWGHGFLRHMVRIVAGTLTEVGRGARSPAWVAQALHARRRAAAGPTAPACGLALVSVTYAGDPDRPEDHTSCGLPEEGESRKI
jgi:tRNA pseudouridine38-40 synthase